MLLTLPFYFPVNNRTISSKKISFIGLNLISGCFLKFLFFLFLDRLRNFLILLIIISSLFLIGQLTFQIVLLSNPPYANQDILPNCSYKQEILEEVGFSRLDTAFIYDILRITLPDVWLLTISMITLLVSHYIVKFDLMLKQNRSENRTLNTSAMLNTTAFADNFCPLTNVTKEPSTGIYIFLN